MSDAGSRDGHSRSRSRSPRRERRRSRSRSPRRSFSPRSRSPSPRRDRRRSRSPRRDSHGDGGGYSRSSYRTSDRSSTANTGSGQGRRVYVGNLPYDVRWGNLKDFMRSAGEVLHADVLMMPDGRSKGCGVVEYATASDAQRAIAELSNQTLNGRMVYIREDREQDKGFASGRGGYGGASRGSHSGGGFQDRPHHGGVGGYQASSSAVIGQITQPQLYITNLPFTVGWQDLKDLFRNAGNIVRADVHMGFDGRSKGSGVVLFESTADAQNAFKQFQGYDWQGRMLDIKEDRYASSSRGGMRGGYQDRGGFGGSRGGFAGRGGFQSRGGYSGGYEGGYDSYGAPPPVVEPNPFTDDAWANGEPSATIYVKNLPWSTSNDDLVELFSTIGKVERAEICFEPSGRSKGSGVVQFDAQETASIAIQKFTGYPYGGRPLGLSFVRYGEAPAPVGAFNGVQQQPQAYSQGLPQGLPQGQIPMPAYGFNGGDQEMHMDPPVAQQQ